MKLVTSGESIVFFWDIVEIKKEHIEWLFSCFPEAACGDPDETHTNYAEEKT